MCFQECRKVVWNTFLDFCTNTCVTCDESNRQTENFTCFSRFLKLYGFLTVLCRFLKIYGFFKLLCGFLVCEFARSIRRIFNSQLEFLSFLVQMFSLRYIYIVFLKKFIINVSYDFIIIMIIVILKV